MVKAIVEAVEKLTPTVALLSLKPAQSIDFKAGQFMQIFIEKDGKTLRKSYSIFSPPFVKDHIEICIKVVPGGFTSNYLANLTTGTELELAGPFGHFTLGEVNHDIIFLATGTGISAIKPIIETILHTGTKHDIWLFFGVRTEKDIIQEQHFRALATKHKNFHFIPVLSKSANKDYEHGYIQDAFKKLITPSTQDIFICGLVPMVDAVKNMCKDLGYADEKIHYEKYV